MQQNHSKHYIGKYLLKMDSLHRHSHLYCEHLIKFQQRCLRSVLKKYNKNWKKINMYILYLYINNRIIILNIQKKPHLVMNEKYSHLAVKPQGNKAALNCQEEVKQGSSVLDWGGEKKEGGDQNIFWSHGHRVELKALWLCAAPRNWRAPQRECLGWCSSGPSGSTEVADGKQRTTKARKW